MKKFLLSLTALTLALSAPISAKPQSLEASSSSKALLAEAKNPRITITLPANPSTGYQWFLKQSYNLQLIKPNHSRFVPTANKRPGASGYVVWTFDVQPLAFVVPHRITLEFIYARPWEKTQARSEIFVISTATKAKP